MDPQHQDTNKQRQSQLRSLIQFAFSQRKFKKVVELADSYHAQFPSQKDIHLYKAKAQSQLSQPSECLKTLDSALQLTPITKQLTILRIRSLIELGNVKEAERDLRRVIEQDRELKTVFQLWSAVNLIKDDFGVHRLSQKEEAILASMKNWLEKPGAKYDKLKVVNLYPGYRGVIATKHIKKKQPIVFIPKSQLITLEMAKANHYTQQLIQKKVKLHSPKHTYLSIFLLEIKNNPTSKFKPYIDLLPEDHSCFPINFSKKQLQLLQGSPFLNMIYQKVIDLKRDYESLSRTDPSSQKYSFKQFCWARMMIGSRIFGLLISGVKTEVLVPFADMLNHRQPKQTVWNYQEAMNGFVIESLEDIEVGQEVFDSYGRKCNSRFLLNYGFILHDNPDNQIPIKVTIGQQDPLHKLKKQMIQEPPEQPYTQIKKISLNLNSNKFYQLMGILRFTCIDELQTLAMLKKISNIEITKEVYMMTRTPPISLRNQVLVWKKLGELCLEAYRKYPNSVEEDEKILRNTSQLTQNQKNIINLRMGQKILLREFMQICNEVNEILNSQNLIDAIEGKIGKRYTRYLYKILSLTPGINKKNMEKRLGSYFAPLEQKQQQTEQIAET